MSDETQNPEETAAAEAPVEAAAPAVEAEAPAAAPAPEAPAGADVEVPAKFKSIVEAIEAMSVIELNELVKLFEVKFGVSAAATAVAGPAAGGDAEEQSSTATVKLVSSGDQKIAVIKVVKEALSLGLKEAKDLVDAAPSVLKEGMKREEAEELKTKIEAAGGKAELV